MRCDVSPGIHTDTKDGRFLFTWQISQLHDWLVMDGGFVKTAAKKWGVGGREDIWDRLNVYVTLWYHYINSAVDMLPEPHCSSYLSQRSVKPHVTMSLLVLRQ